MKSRKHLVFANWKMNPGSVDEAKRNINSLKRGAKDLKRTEVVICPPFPFLPFVKSDPKKKIFSGAQDVFWQPTGTFTGEVSSEMVRSIGAKYVIVGHSDRRNLGETNEIVAKKVGAALLAGLNVVLCVGESERNNSGDYLDFLRKQMTASLLGVRKKFLSELIIAYEPIWAISKSYASSEAMMPSDIHETTLFLRKILVEIFGKDWANVIRIIYGGSANAENCQAIIGGGEVDGLLVGRESLNAENFLNLLKSVDVIPL